MVNKTVVANIQLLSLGGTISLSMGHNGALSTNNSANLIARVAQSISNINLSYHALVQKDGVDISFYDLCRLGNYIISQSGLYDGFIISTGTDTLEEVAFFLHELFPKKKIIVTGAMRPPFSEEFDGIDNIAFAAKQLAGKAVIDDGVYVSLGGSIVPAILARKTNSYALDAFAPTFSDSSHFAIESSFSFGNNVDYLIQANRLHSLKVAIFFVSIDTWLDTVLLDQLDGVVIACPGSFSLPEQLLDKLSKAAQTKPIALASRCLYNDDRSTSLYPGYFEKIEAKGFCMKDYVGLTPHQARIRLMLQLSIENN